MEPETILIRGGRVGGVEKWTHRARAVLGASLVAGAAAALLPFPAFSQTDSVTIVPDPRYEVGGFARWWLGSDYRDLWTMPIRVPVLRLGTIGGGLRPVEVGGGQQTRSLELVDAQGREYRFRSVIKRPARATSPDFDGSLVGWILQDQVSSTVPAAPVPASRLTLAAGFLHPRPVLYVMGDDPALGEFRDEFAGMLGTFEEYPDEWTGRTPGFGGFIVIESSDDVLELVATDPRHRLDARTYLGARLVDLIMGDWDRHEDQWRWAQTDSAGSFVWTPIARDRDYAFAEYDGTLMAVVRRVLLPNTVRFSSGYRDLPGLLLSPANLDRRVLVGMDRAAWDSITATVQASLTDEEIEAAIASMPPEFVAARGTEITTALRARRDSLPAASAAFYRSIARVPEIRGTTRPERAVIERRPDGAVQVALRTDAGERYFERVFVPGETAEIHVYLEGGNDVATVRGASASEAIRVRIIGGSGDDVLADSSTVGTGGRWTTLHDHEGTNELIGGGGTGIDRRPYEPPVPDPDGLAPPQRQEPGRRLGLSPLIDYSTTRGVVVGARVEATRYAFRREPFATRFRLGAQFSTQWTDFGVAGDAVVQTSIPWLFGEAAGIATRIDAMRFYGLGNETVRDLPSELYVVRRNLLEGSAGLGLRIVEGGVLRLGVAGYSTEPWRVTLGPLDVDRPRGSGQSSAFGFRSDLGLELSADSGRVRYGLDVGGSAFPFVSDQGSAYGGVRAEARARIDLGADGATGVAARVGGEQVWGDYPFFAAAFLGGRESLRGLPRWRHAGDAAVYAGAEGSVYVGRVPILLNWRVAPFVFFDVGRVFLEGEVSDRWHSAPGAGLAFSALEISARASYAHGPEPRLYFELSAPF